MSRLAWLTWMVLPWMVLPWMLLHGCSGGSSSDPPPDGGMDASRDGGGPDGGPDGGDGGPGDAAVDGGLDAGDDAGLPPSLDRGDVITVDWERGGESAWRAMRQPDGKIVAVSRNGHNSAILAVRFTEAGEIDPTFGDEGVAAPFVDRMMHAGFNSTAATMQPDGKILFAVTARSVPDGESGMVVIRLTADGELDPSFGTDGLAVGPTGQPFDMTIQPDGKILVTASPFDGFGGAGVARFLPDGSLDGSFGTDGEVRSVAPTAWAIEVDPSGRILLAGTAPLSSWGVTRLLSTGELDTSFGSEGSVSIDVPTTGAAGAVEVDGDGRIVLGGWTGNDGFVARLTEEGALDTSFADAGRLGPIDAGQVTDLVLQPDDRIVTVQRGPFGTKCHVRRYATDGSPDTTFGTDGVSITELDAGQALVLGDSGDITAAGIHQPTTGELIGSGTALVRLSEDGAPVATFGDDGLAHTGGLVSADEEGRAVLALPDGKIVAVGPGQVAGVLRFEPDGSLDATFRDRSSSLPEPGKVTRALGLPGGTLDDVVRADDGDLLVARHRGISVELRRIEPDGRLDPDFDPDSTSADGPARALVGHPGGRYFAVVDDDDGMRVVGFAEDGSIPLEDTLALPSGSATPSAGGHALAVASDGALVAGGWGGDLSSRTDALVVRLDSDLAPVTSWESDGFALHDLTPLAFENVRELAVLDDGHVLAVGVAADRPVHEAGPGTPRPTESRAFAVRLRPDGSLDASFGTDGVWSSDLGTGVAGAFGLAARADGSLFVAATRWTGERDEGLVVALTPEGDVDAGFVDTGMFVLTHGKSSRLRALTLEPSGSLLAVGSAFVGAGAYDLALVRIE